MPRSTAGGRAAERRPVAVAVRPPRPLEGSRTAALQAAGLAPRGTVHWNPPPAALYEHAVRRGEGLIAEGGAFCAVTAPHTGRSPNDKFIVCEPSSAADIWWGRVNQPLDPAHFARLKAAVLAAFQPAWHLLHAPDFAADPAAHGTRSGTFIVLHFAERTILVGGTRYAGELKKAVFTALNYLLPKRGVLSMHCSANVGETGDVALFFGLSGTGKTTLSADPARALIGDDEHGWSDTGVFNIEGGCYAKVIRLSPEGEPEIYATTRRF